MGYDASAYSVIGIKVPAGDLMVEKTVRVKDGPEGAKFDPDTGEPLFKTTREPIEGYEPWDHLAVGDRRFEVKYANCEDDKVVISVWSQRASQYGEQFQECFLHELPSGAEFDRDKALLQEALGDLFDEENWGFFTLLYESW
jgi:hypothetical protein